MNIAKFSLDEIVYYTFFQNRDSLRMVFFFGGGRGRLQRTRSMITLLPQPHTNQENVHMYRYKNFAVLKMTYI